MDSLDDRVFKWFFADGCREPSIYNEEFSTIEILNYCDFLYQLDDVLYDLVILEEHHYEWDCEHFSHEEGITLYASIDFYYDAGCREYICIDKDIEPILIRIFNEYQYRRSGAKREVEALESFLNNQTAKEVKKSRRL